MQTDRILNVKRHLQNLEGLEFAVLVGSRATGKASKSSDWDIALQWQRDNRDYMNYLARTESTRHELANLLQVPATQVDLIDVPSAKLAMRELIANEGVVLAGENSLPWIHFLHRTWRDLEDHYWEELYVA